MRSTKNLRIKTTIAPSTLQHANELFASQQQNIYVSTDRMFAVLMAIQWVAGIIAALWIAPRTWIGTTSQTHVHVWAAIFIGGAINLFPILLAIKKPGATTTRYVIATAQMLMSALLIHLTGGRIETHFHVFGSLAFLAFYRDWRVLVPATIVVAADHLLRGIFWPQSVYGILSASEWRWLEHAGWVLFEDTFLFIAIKRSVGEMWGMAQRTAALNDNEQRYRAVVEQTAEGLILADVDTKRVLECNAAFANLLGYTLDEALTLTAYDFVVDERQAIERRFGNLLDRRLPITGERRFRRKDDSIIHVEINVSVIVYGGKDVFCTSVRDISERKQAEEALRKAHDELEAKVIERTAELAAKNEQLHQEVRERKQIEEVVRNSEERYRLLFDSNPLPLWVYDLETLSFLAVNDAAISHYGYSRDEFLAMTITDIRPPEDVPVLLHNIPTEGARVEWSRRWKHRKKDGAVVDVEITSDALDYAGRPARIVLVSDVTERKRAEEARRQTEQQYESLVNSIEGIVWEADPETFRFTFVSMQAERLLGYPPAQWIEEPSFWPDHIHPDDREWAVDFCVQATKGGKDHQFEYRMIAADGRVVWLRDNVTVSVVEDDSVRLRGVMLDITERKHAEEALSESQKWLTAVYDSSRDGIIVEENERIVFVNQSYAHLFGYTTDELMGQPVWLVSEQEPSERMLEYSRRRIRGEEAPSLYEFRGTRKDGTTLDLEASVSTAKIGEKTYIISLCRDITERKLAEAEILLQKARFEQLFENAPLGILRVDENDIVLDANKEFQDIFQFSLDEMRGRAINEIVVPKAHREEGASLSSRVLDGEIIDLETVRQRKDGVLIPVQIYGVPIVVNEKPVGVFAIYVDLSERKRAQEEIAHLAKIVESSDDAIIGKDLDGTITSWNHGAQELYGYRAEEVVGRSISLLVPPDRSDELPSILELIEKDQGVRLNETERLTKNGTLICVSLTISPMKDASGRISGASTIARDITANKRMEAERQAIFEIIQGVNTTHNLDELLSLIHKSIGKLLYTENCFVALHDEATDLMRFPFWVDKFDPCPPPRPIGVGFSSHVLRTGRPLLLSRELTEQMYRSGEVEKSGSDSASWLGVPLQTASRTIGVLVVQHYEDENAYDERDLQFLASVGSQIALAIERKQAEKEIARLAPFPDENPNPVIETGLEGKLRYINPAAAREFPDLDTLGVQHPILEDLAATIEQLRHQEGDSVTGEISVGESVYEQKITYASDSIRIYAHDITERKRAEEALDKQRAFLRQVIDLNPSFIFAKDREGRFTLVNQALAEAYGVTVERLLGKTDADFNPNKEDVEWFRRDDLDVMDSRTEKFIPEEAITDAAGNTRWLQTIKRPIISPDGTAAQLLGVATDITERKKAEQALRESEAQFRQSQKMEGIGVLAGGIAHDFNNLMTAVTGYSELALRSIEADHPLRPKIEEIKKAGERAASLTRQLLAFSRKQMLSPKVLDLNTIITGMGKMLPRMIGEDIDLRLELAVSLGQIKADPGQIEQVVMNLAVNARDAMPKGGRLTIKTENVNFDGRSPKRRMVVEPGHYVMLSVTDDGYGMDADTQARIFEPFFTTKEVGKGTGLGLSTVYGIVKQSGGSVWVYSEPGKGTTFRIYLPKVDEIAETKNSADRVRAVPRGDETILLVEDEEMVRDLSKEILEAYGYDVIAAPNGKEGLRICQEFEGDIDLLITDVIMPVMSGPELAVNVASLRPDTRVIYMSGFTDDAIVRHGMVDDGISFIQKPFSPDALALKAREVLDQNGRR